MLMVDSTTTLALFSGQWVAGSDVHRDGVQSGQVGGCQLVQGGEPGHHVVHNLFISIVLPATDISHEPLHALHQPLEVDGVPPVLAVVGDAGLAQVSVQLESDSDEEFMFSVAKNSHLESRALAVRLGHTEPDAPEEPGDVGKQDLLVQLLGQLAPLYHVEDVVDAHHISFSLLQT